VDGTKEAAHKGEMHISRPAVETLLVQLSGSWTLQRQTPTAAELQGQLEAGTGVRRLVVEARELTGWDSGLVTFLRNVARVCTQRRIAFQRDGLPDGVRRLLDLAAAVPERVGARREAVRGPILTRIGKATTATTASAGGMLGFIGEAFLAFLKLLRWQAHFRRVDLALLIQECGAQALPIVTVINFLVGASLAFIGAVQLQQFGAQIYVANLVGLAMALEMGAMMTAIIIAGLTGAAFAAQLGTIQVNQEIDALTTLGVSPMEFLVVPRMLALMLMVPVLTIYADLMGMLGGAAIAAATLDVSVPVYVLQLQEGLTLKAFAQGLIKSAVYGGIIALSGCMHGMQCGRSAAAVGEAATSAVATGIVGIIVSSAVLTVIYLEVW
jgi:phospholipid/cholesterol/gamma-HCH transport system permease protein